MSRMSSTADYRDPRLNRTSDMDKKQSPSRGDPRLRAQEQHPPQNWPPQHRLTQMTPMPQTHYTIGDGLTTYQHLVPNAATMYPTTAVATSATYQYPGYAAAPYPSTAYGHPTYAAYYAPAPPPPPQHIEQPYQQPPTVTAQAQVGVQSSQTYAPQGAPQGSWAPARMSEQVSLQMQAPISAYMQQQQQQAVSSGGITMPPSPDITSTSKQEGVEQEMQQTQAEMRRQRDDYERRAAALSHELDQLKKQKRDLKQTGQTDRQTASILKDNSKLQVEIQSKLKECVNVVDILTGILGDCNKKGGHHSSKEHQRGKDHDQRSSRSSRERQHNRSHTGSKDRDDRRDRSRDKSADGGESTSSTSSSASSSSQSDNTNNSTAAQQNQLPDLNATVQYNYVHYDPEIHWCRICDTFPRTAKDLLQHLHDDDHRHLMQAENIEIPWHKLPTQDKEFPHRDGATKRRVPIKGLQFFVSAPAWYCRLCDAWIGDLHCASQHLKSVGHSQNFANFVDQNPQWEAEWLDDRKKALDRVSKNAVKEDKGGDSVLDLVSIEKKAKTLASVSSMHLDSKKRDKSSKKSKRKSKKKAKKHSKDSDDSSSPSSSSSTDEDTSSENDDVDKSKSIRVAMRNQVTKSSSAMMDEQILILENLVKEKKRLQQEEMELTDSQCKTATITAPTAAANSNQAEDRLISQWMNVDLDKIGAVGEKDKYLLDSLKDRLRQKHEAEQRARLMQQQQAIDEETKKKKERDEEREREQREKSERIEQSERELAAQGVHSSNREQVKFRQFRGSKSATHRRPSSASASPPAASNNDSNRYPKSRSRSSSAERHRRDGIVDQRDRSSYRHQRARDSVAVKRKSSRSRSRSRSNSSSSKYVQRQQSDVKYRKDTDKKMAVTTAVVNQKKLPFIGRMPLFKNRKLADDQHGGAPQPLRGKHVTTSADNQLVGGAVGSNDGMGEYEMPRQSRFQPGNLARAFIPQPDVVHYPKLTTQPTIVPVAVPVPVLPEPPRISVPQPPPPPKIQQQLPPVEEHEYDMQQYQQQVYEYTEAEFADTDDHELMNQLPPLPPFPPPPPPKMHFAMRDAVLHDHDDLAMLGISSDDMAAQVF